MTTFMRRSPRRRALTLLAATLTAVLTATSLAAAPAEAAGGSLSGRLLSDGRPLAGIQVQPSIWDERHQQWSSRGPVVITDQDGAYAYPGLEPGRYMISAYPGGLATGAGWDRQPAGPDSPGTFAIDSGAVVSDLELPQTEPVVVGAGDAALAGRMVDGGGEALHRSQRTRLELERWQPLRSFWKRIGVSTELRPHTSRFSFTDVAPGTYRLCASNLEGYFDSCGDQDRSTSSGRDAPGAATIAAGETGSIIFSPAPEPARTATIDVQVLRGGRPVPDAFVTVPLRDRFIGFDTPIDGEPVDEDGRASIPVWPATTTCTRGLPTAGRAGPSTPRS